MCNVPMEVCHEFSFQSESSDNGKDGVGAFHGVLLSVSRVALGALLPHRRYRRHYPEVGVVGLEACAVLEHALPAIAESWRCTRTADRMRNATNVHLVPA